VSVSIELLRCCGKAEPCAGMSADSEPYSSERTKETTKPAAVLSATVGPPCS
jgi:hypothetical protein